MRIVTLTNPDGSFPCNLCVIEDSTTDMGYLFDAIRTTLRQERYNDDGNYYIDVRRTKCPDECFVVVTTDEFIQPVDVFLATIRDIRWYAA
jgi:hypothetical protein